MFGGLTVSGDPDAPGEISSLIGAITGSHAIMTRLKAMESPEYVANAERMRPRYYRRTADIGASVCPVHLSEIQALCIKHLSFRQEFEIATGAVANRPDDGP